MRGIMLCLEVAILFIGMFEYYHGDLDEAAISLGLAIYVHLCKIEARK